MAWMGDIQLKVLFLQLLTATHTTKLPEASAVEKRAFRKETGWSKWEDMAKLQSGFSDLELQI